MTEAVSKRLSTCIGSTYSMYRVKFSWYWITLYENDRTQFHVFYARRGETSRYVFPEAFYANFMHRQTCVVSKYGVVGNIVPCQDETLSKNNLYNPETIPSRTETSKTMQSTMLICLVSILKIGVITSLGTRWSSFTLLRTVLGWCGRHSEIERCTMFSRLPWKQAMKNFLRR